MFHELVLSTKPLPEFLPLQVHVHCVLKKAKDAGFIINLSAHYSLKESERVEEKEDDTETERGGSYLVP